MLPRSTRASGCRAWRRWPAARRSSPPTARALPETCGDAALLVDPTDQAAIADAVLAAIGDAGLRARGLRRAAEFSWERTAGELAASLPG